MTMPAQLDVARAALAAAELRTGVRHRSVRGRHEDIASAAGVTGEQTREEELTEPFAAVLDGGRLPTGSTSVVGGSSSLLLALLAASQHKDDWIAIVGMPDLGLLAAVDAGVGIDRLVVIPDVTGRGPEVLAALLDGFTYVVAGPAVGLTVADRRRLTARARDRGSGIVATGEWEHAALRLYATARWSGVDAGAGYLRRCELDVDLQSRGRPQRWTLTLPTPQTDAFIPAHPGSARRSRTAHRAAPLHAVG
ncbi:hypothetical protein [Isoptericola sp. NPDC056578]|uniref:hypothetical protein n=1 Tax=unclassified Isoptericola TaxID=2623355 RepID=UPI00369F4FD8